MSNILQWVYDGFWNEHFWLLPNTTWKSVAPGMRDGVHFREFRDLYFSLLLAFILLGLRFCLEKFCFGPIGISLGIKNYRMKKAPSNAVLENAYLLKKKINSKEIQGLAKQVDWTENKVQRWMRLRKSQDKPTSLVKFSESAWRFLYYLSSFTFGMVMLWDKPWLWNIKECWYAYPNHSMTAGVWWYYMISLAFYWSLGISQFFDIKRKDFWEMFIHHLATISLLSFSWIGNFFRIGTLILVVHDCADILLEITKMVKYAGYHKLCEILFAAFMILWIVTRIGFYPFWIMYSVSFEAPKIVTMFPAYYLFEVLLALLLVLHIFWTYLILQVAYKALKADVTQSDIRSSSSDCSEDSEPE